MEAQFLVLKDTVLNRTKEININGLVDKLTTSLEDHYKTKLISVANGRFEGVYSRRFKGMSKKSKEGYGLRLPSPKEQLQMVENVQMVNQNSYYVPSCDDENKTYLVDMDVSTCECKVGESGAPCKHQYIIWAHILKKGTAFLPYLSPDDRREYSYLAIGEYLPQSCYEGLHCTSCFVPPDNNDVEFQEEQNQNYNEATNPITNKAFPGKKVLTG